MAGLFGRRKPRGLFGYGDELPPLPGLISGYGGGTFNMDGSVATPPDRMETTPIESISTSPPQESAPKKKGLLSGFFGGDFADRAARAMAFVNDDYQGAAQISQQMRKNAMMQRNQAALGKALDGMKLTPEQRQMLANNPDIAEKFVLKSMEPQTPEYGYTQDNAGNMWQYDKRTGKFADQPSFIDKAPKQFVDPSNGRVVNVQNPYMQQGGPARPQSKEDLDALPAGSEYIAPDGTLRRKTGSAPRANLINAPRLNAQQGGQVLGNAMGAKTITPQEADMVRRSLGPNGQAAFEKWLRDNNIQIGGF